MEHESFDESKFPSTNLEGVERVKDGSGKYAFFMEQGSLDYTVKENCDLMQVGAPLNARNYGFGLEKGGNIS